MAFPLVLGGVGQKIIGGISFKEPSEKRAAKVLPQVVNSGLGGNLLAIAMLENRAGVGIAKERAVWQGGYNQVSAGRPDLVQAYQQRRDALLAMARAGDNSGPEAAAAWAVANVVTKDQPTPAVPTGGATLLPGGTPTNGAGRRWLIGGALVVGGILLYGAFRRR